MRDSRWLVELRITSLFFSDETVNCTYNVDPTHLSFSLPTPDHLFLAKQSFKLLSSDRIVMTLRYYGFFTHTAFYNRVWRRFCCTSFRERRNYGRIKQTLIQECVHVTHFLSDILTNCLLPIFIIYSKIMTPWECQFWMAYASVCSSIIPGCCSTTTSIPTYSQRLTLMGCVWASLLEYSSSFYSTKNHKKALNGLHD